MRQHPLTAAFRIAALSAMLFICCGFSWGMAKSDPCTDARTLMDTLAAENNPGKRSQLEQTILASCPDGAAGLFVRAVQAEKVSKQDVARKLYREALALDSTLAEAHGNLGLLLLEQGSEQEASVELTKGLLGRPDPRYHRALARIMRKGALPALALFHYDEALRAFPDDSDLRAGRAEIYVQLGKYANAEEELVSLKALNPAQTGLKLELADVYRKAGKLDRAIEEIRSYLRSNSSSREGHRQLAEVLMEKGDREAARKEYLLAGVDVTVNPEDFARKGDEYFEVREFGQAITAFQTALKGRPNWPEVQLKLGKAQMAAGRDDYAMSTLNALVKGGYKDGAVYYDLGLLHERSGRLDDAISAYRLSIIQDPGNVNAHRRLAEIFTWRGNFAEAVDIYRELIRIRGDNPLYHLNLARLYDRSRNMKGAVSEYEAAVRLDPDTIEGHRELAGIFIREKQFAKVEQHYKEILRIQGDDESAHNAMITLYFKQKRFDDLSAFVKAWLDKAPDDPQRHYRMGIVYELKKEYDLSVNEYKKSLELQPDNSRVLFALGRTYMKTGRLSESREMLEASKKADPTFAEPQLLLSSIGKQAASAKRKNVGKKTRHHTQNKSPSSKQVPSGRRRVKK